MAREPKRRYLTPPPDDMAAMWIESLHWTASREDVVAAARFLVFRVLTGQKITTIDAYLLTSGGVEMWEDDGPVSVDLPGGDYSGHPSEEWRAYIEPMLAAALAEHQPGQARP